MPLANLDIMPTKSLFGGYQCLTDYLMGHKQPPYQKILQVHAYLHKQKEYQWLLLNGTKMLRHPHQTAYPWNNHECWNNAWHERFLESEVTEHLAYAEGAMFEPVNGGYTTWLHGWNMLAGCAWDTTRGTVPGAVYLGVVFSDEFLSHIWSEHRISCGFLNYFDQLWPYLDNYAEQYTLPLT